MERQQHALTQSVVESHARDPMQISTPDQHSYKNNRNAVTDDAPFNRID